MDEFAGAFDSADVVFVLSIYEASEQPITGVSAEALAARIRGAGHEHVSYAGAIEGAARTILPSLRPGDLVVTLGAGSVTSLGPQLLDLLRQQEATEESANGEA